MKIKPKAGVVFTCIDGFDLDQDKLENYQKKFINILDRLNVENKNIDFIVKNENDAKKANEIFSGENLDIIILVVAVWTPDSLAISLLNNLNIPVIVFTTSLSTQAIGINGAQVISASLKELSFDFKFIFGEISEAKTQKKIIDYCFAAAIVRRLKSMRIGLIGYIPEIMLSLNFDIFAVKKVFGPTVVPVDFYKLNDYVERARKNLGSKIDSKIDYIKKNVGKVMVSDETVSESLSFYYAFLELAKDLNLDSIAINCFPTPAIKGKTCLAVSNLNDEGIVAACEGDVNSAIIMSAFNLITGKASLNSDLIIEYENENQIMFSHCGGGPFSCASKMSDIILDKQYEVKSGLGVYYPVKTGGKEVTIINLVGNELTYRMCILNGTSVALDKLTYYGNPINVKFKTDVEDLINTIGNEGFGHHWMLAFGDYKYIFLEICKMLKIYCINID